MKTSSLGFSFIKQNEGLSLTVIGDAGGKQQVGYGHDLLPGESYPCGISAEYAEVLLKNDVLRCEIDLNRLGWDLNQNQFDALIDFRYNAGGAALKMLASHGIDKIPDNLPKWVYTHVNGSPIVLKALKSRRAAEVGLWRTVFKEIGCPVVS